MAQHSTFIYSDTFAYDEAREQWYTILQTSSITGFMGTYAFSAISILKIQNQRFKTAIVHYEIDTSGNLYIYADEPMDLKIVLITDT